MIDIKKYSFKKYTKAYPEYFSQEKRRLRRILPHAKIEHIGSTAVKGLGGKGIVDIAIAVPEKDVSVVLKKLQEINFVYKPSGGTRDRKFLFKIIRHSGKERRVHLQLTHNNSRVWKRMVSMRDYLKNHKDSAKDYARIKKLAVKFAKGKGKKYREYKERFLTELQKKALREQRRCHKDF